MAEAIEHREVPAVKTCEVCGVEYRKKKGVSAAQWLRSRACSRSCSSALGQTNRTRPSREERFWNKVDRASGHGPHGDCWLWTGHRIKFGYGSFRDNGRIKKAHRVAYEIACQPVADEISVLHRCDFPSCVRPDHLFLGDHEANMADMVAKGRGDAPKGEAHHDAKLTEDQVRLIRTDPRSQRAIAHEYGVSRSAIMMIKTAVTGSTLVEARSDGLTSARVAPLDGAGAPFMNFVDAVSLAGTRRTADGYLVADAKAVRTGIQTYLGSEVGRPDLRTVQVYRSEKEVRSADSLRSFSHAPVTLDHPAEAVTSANWKDLAVGEVSTAATWDGNRISLPLILKDAAAIAQAEAGKRELSAGYTCDLDWTPGVTADGQPFDAQQQNIRANHVAIVARGRAGAECRIGDADPHTWGTAPISPAPFIADRETVRMTMHLIDGHSVEMSDAAIIAVGNLQKQLGIAVADALAKDTALSAAVKAHDAAIQTKDEAHAVVLKAKDTELAQKDAEIEKLKASQVTDAALDVLATARADVIGKAKAIVSDVKTDGISIPAIRRAVVTAKLGDAAIKDRSDDYVEARFDLLADRGDALGRSTAAPIKTGTTDSITDPHAKRTAELRDAWKHQSAA